MLEDSENPSTDLEIAMENAMDGNPGSMLDHLVELFYNELLNVEDDARGHTAFRFTSFQKKKKGETLEDNPVVKDILNGSLTFSNPANFNDPMDPIVREWLNIQKKKSSNKSYRSLCGMMNRVLKSNLRMACLSTPAAKGSLFIRGGEQGVTDCSLLMWAHYAAMHKGICIEYEITDDTLQRYNDESQVMKWCEVRYRGRKAVRSDVTLDNALLAKSAAWEYEEESRLIYFSKEPHSSDYITLSGFPVKAVYLGYRIPSETKAAMKKLLIDKNIRLCQMHFCNEDITQLEVREIR